MERILFSRLQEDCIDISADCREQMSRTCSSFQSQWLIDGVRSRGELHIYHTHPKFYRDFNLHSRVNIVHLKVLNSRLQSPPPRINSTTHDFSRNTIASHSFQTYASILSLGSSLSPYHGDSWCLRPTMGFLTGLFSGLTLTTATLYLSLSVHQRSRLHQAAIVRQQSLLLNSLVDPSVLYRGDDHDDYAAPRYRLQRGDWVERWKDEWNSEVEGAVRWVQAVRWGDLRDGVEGRWRDWREGGRRL